MLTWKPLIIGSVVLLILAGIVVQLTAAPPTVALAPTPTSAPATATAIPPAATVAPSSTTAPATATPQPAPTATATSDPASRIVFADPVISVTKDAVSASVTVRNADTVTHAFNAEAYFYSTTVANLPADPADALVTAGVQAVILKAGESRTVTIHAKDFTNPHVLGVTFRATQVQ